MKTDNAYIVDATKKGYTVFDNWLFFCPLSCAEKMVYIVLKSHAWSIGRAFPSHATIALKATLSVSTIKRAIKSLIAVKLIRVKSNKSKGTSNVYYLCDLTTTERDLRAVHDDLPCRSHKSTGRPRRATNNTNTYPKTTTTNDVVLKELKELMDDSPFAGVDITPYLRKISPSKLLDQIDKLIFTYRQTDKTIRNPSAVLVAALSKGVASPGIYIPYAERKAREQAMMKKKEEAERTLGVHAEKERLLFEAAERKYEALSSAEKESLREKAKQLIPFELRDFKYAIKAKVFELIINNPESPGEKTC